MKNGKGIRSLLDARALRVYLLLTLTCTLIFPFFLLSQEVERKFYRLSMEERLCHNDVYAVIQGHQGFMWFATQNGLARYDGNRFLTLYHDPLNSNTIASNNFGKLLADRDGMLWLGTWGEGLDRYDPTTGTFTHFKYNPQNPASICSDMVSYLFEDKDGDIWIGTAYGGMDRYDKETGIFFHYKHKPGNPAGLSSDRIRAICQDRQGYIWAATYGGGLNRLDVKAGTFTHYKHRPNDPASISHNYIRTICLDKDGRLWLGTRGGGVDRFDPANGQVTHYRRQPGNNNSLGSDNINFILQDGWGILWIGMYDRGLDRFDPANGRFEHFSHQEKDRYSLSHNRIEWMHEDRSGVLWIATRGGGMNRLDLKPPRFKHYLNNRSDSKGLSIESTYTITADRDGNTWFGTDGGGVSKLSRDKRTGKTKISNFQPNPSVFKLFDDFRVWSLLEDSAGTLWIGTYSGLKTLDPRTGVFSRPSIEYAPGTPLTLDDPLIAYIYEDRQGRIWFCTVNGMFRVTREYGRYKGRHFVVNETGIRGNNPDYIATVFMDGGGRLWVSSAFGLSVTGRPGEDILDFTHYSPRPGDPQSLSHKSVRVLHEDRKGRFWVGTARGLNLMNREKGTFSHFSRDNSLPKAGGLPNNSICGILEDDNGNLWISTSNGLCKFNFDKMTFRNFDIHDGLLSNDFNFRAFFKMSNGEMFFGGGSGAISFFPGRVMDNPHVPPVVITAFKVFDQPRPYARAMDRQEVIRLGFLENSFSFEFSALDYTNPGKNRFAYRLEGFEPGWIQRGNRRFVEYTNIPPGEYTFRVKASNNDGVWNETGTSLKLRIVPPFWRTTWFRLLLLAVILSSIYLAYTLRLKAVHSRQRNLEKLVAQRTRQLEIANEKAEQQRQTSDAANRAKSEFLARMSHEIRTPLNSIIGFNELLMETKLDNQQVDYVKTVHGSGELLLELINEILDFSKIEAGQLTLESVDFNPETSAYDICRIISPRIGDKPVELVCRTGDFLPDYVNGDVGKFRQVLMNLVGNAVKFTPEGEIELFLDGNEVPPGQVELDVWVRDSGIGIPEDKLESIFEVFQQADGSTNRKYGGSGLGLSICRQIARLMGGDIRVESEPGKGSTFFFSAILKASEKEAEPLDFPVLKGKRALIVDDNPHSREILVRLLEKVGMKVTPLDKAEGVAAEVQASFVGKEPVDICLLDTRMPRRGGHELAKELRSGPPTTAFIPLLALASPNERWAQQFVESGFDAFIPRPPEPLKLLEMMTRLLGEQGDLASQDTVTQILTLPRFHREAHTPCILVAEDNQVNRKLIRHILERAGYELEIAVNGKEILECYTTAPGKYDLILMDVQMPEMNGIEATKAIRKWEQESDEGIGYTRLKIQNSSGIPIIALTAQTVKGDREKCLQSGMDDFVSKPIKKDVLLDTLEKWLNSAGGLRPGD
jgi:signal transduction histidine kinase/ligand-binding sensor domain-containing protein/CheY-like chemotaxis protein